MDNQDQTSNQPIVQAPKPFLFSQDLAPGSVTQDKLVPNPHQQGDMYYGLDGVRFARLGIGNSGQVLAVSAGVPAYSSTLYAISGNVGINNANPSTAINLINTNFNDTVHLTDYSGAVYIIGRVANGPISSPSVPVVDDSLLGVRGGGYNGIAFTTSRAQVNLNAAETWSSTANGAYINFVTTKKGTSTRLERMRIDDAGNVIVGTAALATTATDGFLYIPTCAGTPTGVPTTYTGRVPIVYDTTGNKLWIYNGAWKSVALA